MMARASLSERIKCAVSPHKRYIYKHLSEFSRLIAFKSSSKVTIDVGAGTSPYKRIFCPNDLSKYISIDVEHYPNLNVIGVAQKFPFKSHIADVVLLIEVLEHIYETQEVLKEINRVLKPNGYLISTVPFILGYHTAVDCFRFTDDSLKRLLEENGFKIKIIKKRGGIFASLSGVLFQLPYPIFKSRKLALFLWVFLIPLVYISLALDCLDKRKDYTLGYDILASKLEEV